MDRTKDIAKVVKLTRIELWDIQEGLGFMIDGIKAEASKIRAKARRELYISEGDQEELDQLNTELTRLEELSDKFSLYN